MELLNENKVFDKVRDIICNVSTADRDKLHNDIRLDDIFDSLETVSVTVEVGKAFGVRVPLLKSIGDIVQFLEKKTVKGGESNQQ